MSFSSVVSAQAATAGEPCLAGGGSNGEAHIVMKNSFVLAFALGFIMSGCSGANGNAVPGLPGYARQFDDGVVRIDLTQALPEGASYDVQDGTLRYPFGDQWTVFSYSSVSEAYGISRRRFDDLSISLSPGLTPNDGIADLFIAVRADADSLEYAVFLDSDWQHVVQTPLFIKAVELGPNAQVSTPTPTRPPIVLFSSDVEIRERHTLVNFDELKAGVYFQGFTFDQTNNPPGYARSPILVITNREGSYAEITQQMGRLEPMDEGDLMVSFSPVKAPGSAGR